MDPDYFTRTKRLSTFFRLYSKILLYGSAIVISIITMIIIAGWDTDATEDFKTNQLGQVLAVTDGEPETGGVTFGIPTQFTSDAQFDASITVAQDSRLDGDVYYRGDLVDLSLLSADGLQLDASSIANVLESGTGISIEGEETLTINNTGVLSFNGQTGDVTYVDTGVLSINGETGHVTLTIDDFGLNETFKTIVIPGSQTITASSRDDSLTFIPGAGIVLESDQDNKSITIGSTLASSAINNIFGTTNQIIVEQVGQDVTLSLPQNIDQGAVVTFSEMLLLEQGSPTGLSLASDGRITTLNSADFYLGGDDTGTIRLVSKGTTSLTLDGEDLTAVGSLTGVTDFTASGDISFTSLGNGVVQSLGYSLSSGPINLSSQTYVSGILSSEFGGTGTDKTPADGQILIGSGLTGEYEPRHLATGNGLSVVRGPYSLTLTNTGVTKIAGGVNHILVNGSYSPTGLTGDVTLTLPQMIHTSASPTFRALTLTADTEESYHITLRDHDSGNNAYFTLLPLLANRTYSLPDASGTVCLSTGNCAGAGGGLVGLGTTNFIPKYSDPGTLTPSLLYDNGTTIGIGTSSPLAGVALDVNGPIRLGAAGGSNDMLNTVAAAGNPGTSLYWGGLMLCDSSGNCVGEDGGVVSNGTNNYLSVFSADGQSLNNSIIYDTGTALGIGTTTPPGFVSISGGSGISALAIDQTDIGKDILIASSSGATKMTLSGAGNLNLVDGAYQHQGSSGVTLGGYSCVTTSGGIVTGSGACPVDPAMDLWESQSNLIYAKDTDADLVLGGTTVNNGKFVVRNLDSGDPTIWLRSSPTRTLSITSSGTISTINDDSITLESGEDILLSPGSGEIVIGGKLVTQASSDLVVEPSGFFHVRPHGQQVLSVSADGVGVNTTISHGALTIKEVSSYAIPGDDDGGSGGSSDGNLILNPADSNFSSNTGNWSLGSGWAINDGVLTYTVGQTSSAVLENQYIGNYVQGGTTYTISFDVLALSMPGPEAFLSIQVGNNAQQLLMENPDWFGNGSIKRHSRSFTPSSSGNLIFSITNNMNITIDNISVTSDSIEPPPPEPPPATVSGPGIVLVSSDGTSTPLEMRAGGSGLNNTFVGYAVGGLNESGSNNTGLGAQSLLSLSSGESNTAFGYQALYSNVDGDSNLALGAGAGYYLEGGSGNVLIGAGAGPESASTFSDQLYIANAAGNPLIWGDFSSEKVAVNLSDPTSSNNTFSVAGSMCVTATGICASNTAGTIYTTNTVVTGADVAENYVSSQELKPGDIVSMANNGNSQAVVKANAAAGGTLLGVVSTTPGVTINAEAQTDRMHPYVYPIALSGRVPTKVSTENGAIAVGDPLTIGKTPGVAVKAMSAGYIIGRALEPSNTPGVTSIVVYANAGWYAPTETSFDPLNDTNVEEVATDTTVFDQILGTTSRKEETDRLDSRITELEEVVQELQEMSTRVDEILTSEKQPIASFSAEELETTQDLHLESLTESASLTLGNVVIDGAHAGITSRDQPLRLQANSSQPLELFNGKITLSESGDITMQGTLTAQKVNIESTDEENRSIGEGMIPKGENFVEIKTKSVTEKSNIFITAKTLFSGLIAVTEQKDGESFKVEIKDPAEEDIRFNWWIVN